MPHVTLGCKGGEAWEQTATVGVYRCWMHVMVRTSPALERHTCLKRSTCPYFMGYKSQVCVLHTSVHEYVNVHWTSCQRWLANLHCNAMQVSTSTNRHTPGDELRSDLGGFGWE